MALHTAAEVISFMRELEGKGAKFYTDLAEKYKKDEDVLLAFAKENEKYVKQIEGAYYSVITDAIEGCNAFNLDANKYALDTELEKCASYNDALAKAVQIEEQMLKFYSDGNEQSKSLLADVPRNFVIVARKRTENRLPKLRALMERKG
jgi:hypothetical protein